MSDADEEREANERRVAKARASLQGFTPPHVDAKGRTHEAKQVIRDGNCPHCGGSQFKARRTKAARWGIFATGAAGAVVTKQKKVQCVTCGTIYDRD